MKWSLRSTDRSRFSASGYRPVQNRVKSPMWRCTPRLVPPPRGSASAAIKEIADRFQDLAAACAGGGTTTGGEAGDDPTSLVPARSESEGCSPPSLALGAGTNLPAPQENAPAGRTCHKKSEGPAAWGGAAGRSRDSAGDRPRQLLLTGRPKIG